MADGDARWINRGAYDLLGTNLGPARSAAGLPKAVALYGPLPEQLGKPDSFASRLARLLEVRADLKLYAARQVDVPSVRSKGLLVMVHELPEDRGIEVTAINFGSEPVDEVVKVPQAGAGSKVIDALGGMAVAGEVSDAGGMRIRMDGYEGKALLVVTTPR
jgi:hypothetical protein